MTKNAYSNSTTCPTCSGVVAILITKKLYKDLYLLARAHGSFSVEAWLKSQTKVIKNSD